MRSELPEDRSGERPPARGRAAVRRPGRGSGAGWDGRVSRAWALARSPVRIHGAWLRRRFRAAGLREHQVELDSGSVHCWAGGSGPPVMLLHGFGASALWQWYPQVPALARGFRLILPDLLFFGDSTSSRAERTVRFQAAAMLQLAEHLGFRRFHLVGLSYGGFVSLAMASLRPERVGRLCLVGCPGHAMGPEEVERLLRRFGASHVRDILLPRGPEGVRRLIRIAWHRPPRVPGFLLRDTYDVLFCRQVEQQSELLDSLLSEAGSAPAPPWPLPHPVLILWGEHDPIFPSYLADRLRAQLGDTAERTVLNGTAHAPNVEVPARFNRLLMEFLNR